MSNFDEHFPFKDIDGNPQYREGQLDALNAIEAGHKNTKFVCVDGKVGCGKSVINYSYLMSRPGKTVYITPQKQLQDQIREQNWDDVTILKGGSGYACTYCQSVDDIKIKCNYDGDEVKMCNNSSGTNDSESIRSMKNEVASVLSSNTTNGVKMMKSSFQSVADFDKYINKSRKSEIYLYGIYSKIMDGEISDVEGLPSMFIGRDFDGNATIKIPSKYKDAPILSDDTERAYALIEKFVYRNFGCNMEDMECPLKSARTKTSLAKVSVLNPDVMFYMNKFSKRFGNIDTLVVDEAHGFEDVIQRIFSSSIPHTILKDVYGIDMSKVISSEDPAEAMKIYMSDFYETFNMLLYAFKSLWKYRTAISIFNVDSVNMLADNKVDMVKSYVKLYNGNIGSGNAEPLYELIDALSGEDQSLNAKAFASTFSASYETYMADHDLPPFDVDVLKVLIKGISNHVGNMTEARKVRLTEYSLTKTELKVLGKSNKSVIIFEYLMELRKMLDKFVPNTENLSSLKSDSPVYLFSVESVGVESNISKFFKGKGYKGSIDMLSTVIVNTGLISNMFFYNNAKHVLLTSGTWIYKDSMMRALGIPKLNHTFYEIPSTFDKKFRPVYLINDEKALNMTKKSGPRYEYETTKGVKKLTSGVTNLVDSVQSGLGKTTGENVNVIIHTHSFKILYMLAESGYCDPSKYIFHGQNGGHFIGGHLMHDKEAFMEIAGNNPNKGLVFVSPSITEGVDFKHELARAQIVLKHPMPNFGSVYLQALMGVIPVDGLAKDPDIYLRKTYTTLIQEYGRVMRDESDWGMTIIYDEKCVKEMISLFKNPYERQRANVEFMMESIKARVISGGKVALAKPTFELKL